MYIDMQNKSGPKVTKGFVLASDIWLSDPKLMFFAIFANFQIFKLLVEYEDTCATERYFVKFLLMVKYIFCKGWLLRVHSMLNLIKTSILGLFLAKIDNFGLDPYIFDAKTDPFIFWGANLFLYYLKHIGIQIIEKNW